MTRNTYSISELAVQLNLPRTTINDWLKNFAPYLEFEMKGKRKEYNHNALNVLKNICKWKNEGKSASAIQKLLEENYGLTGEVAPELPPENTAENVETAANPSDSGELMQVVHSDLEMLLANVEQLNERRIKSTRRAAWTSVIIMFLIFAGVAAAGYFIYMNMVRMQEQNAAAKLQYAKQISDLQAENKQQLEELNKLRKLELDKLSSDFDIRNKEFQKEIKIQKDELSQAFKELEKSVSARREAEMLKLREAFAAEQKAALEKLIAKEKELTAIEKKVEQLQSHAESLRKHTDSLQKKTEELNTRLEKEQQDKKRLEEDYQALNKIVTAQIEDDK